MGITKNRILSHSPGDILGLRFTRAEGQTLLELARSRNAASRKRCVEWFSPGALNLQNLPVLLELADILLPDPNPNIRWRVLVDLSHFLEDQPEKIWPLIIEWGSVYNPDIRAGVALCLLEHLLGYHFEEFFEQSKQAIMNGNTRFIYTLRHCRKMGQAEFPENARCFDEFIESLHLRQWK